MASPSYLPSQVAMPRGVETPAANTRIGYSVMWNLLGAGAPLIASFLSIPVLVRLLGTTRFGALTVMTPILGYAGILDVGLSRALIKMMAERIARGRTNEIPELFWTGTVLTLGCGVFFGAILAAFAPLLAHLVINIPADM